MKLHKSTRKTKQISIKASAVYLCILCLVLGAVLTSCAPKIYKTTDIEEYGDYSGTYNDQFVSNYIGSFFPESLDNRSVKVVRYSYYAKKSDTYGFEAFLELKTNDSDTFEQCVFEIAPESEWKPFVYDSAFMEYSIENVLQLGDQVNGAYYPIEQAKIRKVLFNAEAQTIIYVAIGVYDGGGTGTDELNVFFDRFNIDPAQYAQTVDFLSADPYSIENPKEISHYYEIIQSDLLYYCYFYDYNRNIVRTEGPLTKIPHVEFVDESVVRFTLQAGTGIGTQWGYFYDTQSGVFSDTFQSIYDQADGKVVYTEGKHVIVRNIFDEAAYCKVFSVFGQPFSEVVDPFVEICFAEDGSYVEITYLSGSDYIEITETFQL